MDLMPQHQPAGEEQDVLIAEARFLRTQIDVARVAMARLQPAILLPSLLEAIGGAQGYTSGLFWQVLEGEQTATVMATFGAQTAPFHGLCLPLNAPDALTAQTIRSGHRQPVFCNHVQQSSFATQPITQALDTQALLVLPLIARTGKAIGAFTFGDSEHPERFTERDLAHGTVLAGQVVQALENSDLFHRLQRDIAAREQDQAVLRTLLDINKQIGQTSALPPLLDTIAREAARLLDVPVAIVRQREGDDFVLASFWGEGVEMTLLPRVKPGEHLTGLVIVSRQPVIIDDVSHNDRISTESLTFRRRYGFLAYLGVPLIAGDELLGTLTFHGRTGHCFAPAAVEMAMAFADQAAIAVQRAQLYAQAERRRAAAESLIEMTQLLSQSLDPAEVGQRIVDTVKLLIGAQGAALFRLELPSGDLQAIALSSESPALSFRPRSLPQDTSVAGLAVQARRPMASPNILADPRLALTPELRAQLEQLPPCAVLAVPLLLADEVVGILSIMDIAGREFAAEEIHLVQAFATQAATALRNARLYQDAQDAYRQLARAQEQFVQGQKMQAVGQMASGIAHDINNALSPITLYVESLLASDTTLSARARDYLSTVQQAANDVAHTVARLREFSRQSVDPQEAVPVDLNQVVLQVVELTRARWRDEPQRLGVTIAVHTVLQEEGFPPILGVESELREALINLIFNAVDAMPQGGSLTLRTQATPTAVIVEVIDTGIGMDETTRQRCLEPFYTTKDERGTGLGLAMVYGVTERHAAQFIIESAVGQGTTMRLLFPIALSQGALDVQPADVEASSHPLRILVVDDDLLIRRLLQDVLQVEGHVVTVVDGGRVGLEALRVARERQEPFDVVLTDLGMPEMDGREVARGVKREAPDTPVILLTGWGQALQQDESLPPHVDHLLSKPPRLQELRTVLRTVARAAGRKDNNGNN